MNFKRLYLLTGIFLVAFSYCNAQNPESANFSRGPKDTLFIGVPNCTLSQLGEIKNVLSSLPDAKLVYTCEEERRFMLLIKRKTYPDISSIAAKIKTVDNSLITYEKTGGWNSFFSVCRGEIMK